MKRKERRRFYGPKIDVQFQTAQSKDETLVTVQVDFHLPAQCGLEYVTDEGARGRPTIVHRGILCTMERMVALLIEEYEGNFPLRLAPTQAVVIAIADRHEAYALHLAMQLRAARLRVEVDRRTELTNAKIRDAQLRKIPHMLVVGDREANTQTAALRAGARI